jgi:hypothetical protein
MGIHSLSSIDKLEKQLQERHEKLVATMKGLEISKDEMRMLQHTLPHRRVNAADVRVALDDFATIIKEIRASLGKR